METEKCTWQRTNNPLFIEARKAGKNIRICDGDDPNSKYIAVYCSSNGIYFPNDDETFTKRIVNQDKYDWKSNRIAGVKKHIYIRDIYKQWYVNGINDETNSVDKTAQLIKSVGDENTVYVFLGSSAGAYMALCLCSIIGGIAYAGSPQIELPLDDKRNWLLLEGEGISEKSRYFNLQNRIQQASDSEMYILYGKKNDTDAKQIKLVEDCKNVYLLPFGTNLHGVVFWAFNASDFLKNKTKLKKLSGKDKEYSRLSFSLKLSGLVKTVTGVVELAIIRLKYRKKL